MFKHAITLIIVTLALFGSQYAQAGFIDDSISAKYVNTWGTVFNKTATVGSGVEFQGANLIHSYFLDFSDDAFTLTVTKPSSGGNFTAIFEELIISGIDSTITNVVFDSANSSSFNRNPEINFSNNGTITISDDFFISANSPASALSHSFTWNVEFESVAVNVPSAAALFALGLIFFSVFTRRRFK